MCDSDNAAYKGVEEVPNEVKYLLKLHFPRDYFGMDLYECDKCKQKCKSSITLANHKCNEQITNDVMYSCSKCNSSFETLEDVHIHETYYCSGKLLE